MESIDPRVTEMIELQGNIKQLYDEVSVVITTLVSSGKFDSSQVMPMMLSIIGIVQSYADNKYPHITGPDKKTIALNLLNHVITDLYNQGKITQEEYQIISAGLNFFGGPLIDLAKAAWKKTEAVVDDIAASGCKGCFQRNFSRKDKNKSKSINKSEGFNRSKGE